MPSPLPPSTLHQRLAKHAHFLPSSFLPLLFVLLTPQNVDAYSWNFHEDPQQCRNLTIDVTGNDGRPPYSILMVPFGPSPLPNNVEARRITEQVFSGNDASTSFQLRYPGDSQFVAVVSDSTGFGSGGTSGAARVTSSDDASCFNASENVQPRFVFSIEPPYQIVQCRPTRIWWDSATVQGTPNFLGVIPGGQSFAIPQDRITQVPEQGTGFTWVPNVRGGTTLMIVGGDNRGNGTAGSVFFVVSTDINNNSTCLSNDSPSSTAGSPAGGSYPTGAGSQTGGGVSSGGSNVGAIVGGVVGGLAFLSALLLGLYFLRRRSQIRNRVKERPVDLLNEDEDDDDDHRRPDGTPQPHMDYYTPEPFMVPDPTLATESDVQSHHHNSSIGRPLSGTSNSFSRSETPDLLGGSSAGYGWGATSTTSTNRKGANAYRMRPVNVIQHEDAGPPPPPMNKEDEVETVELPPAYTALGRNGAPTAQQPSTGPEERRE